MFTQQITIVTHELTAEEFIEKVRAELKVAGLDDIADPDYDYFAGGHDIHFDVHHDSDEFACRHEVSISKPFESETYLTNYDGTEYDEYMKFTETDAKTHTGTGIYFLRNIQ